MKKFMVVFLCFGFCLTLAGIPDVAIGQDCSVRVIRDTIAKSHFLVLPALIRIETTGIEPLNLFTRVDFNCEADGDGLFNSISTTGKVIPPNFGRTARVIWQTAIIWPAILTGNAREESETCTVTVEGCDDSDDFELNILSLTIPLEE